MSVPRCIELDWDDRFDALPDWGGRTHAYRQPYAPQPIQKVFVPDCEHWRQAVELDAGVTVFASAWYDRPAKHVTDWPDVGLYLDHEWATELILCSPGFGPRFAHGQPGGLILYPWPDYGTPRQPARFIRALRFVLTEAAAGKRVEIACRGGHGRTGTALAALLVLQGHTPHAAIDRIRRTYCVYAVESKDQIAMLHRVAR